MAKVCCVCNESKETPENKLFFCRGHSCDVTVHQACYGIVTLPSGQWFCRKCESQERAARVRCELCPKKEGALKRTDCGGWAHVVCALYIPEVTFGNNGKMEPIITSKLPKERFTKSCYICEDLGLENQASYGACMSCHKSSCRLAFHVTCAQKERLLCEEEDSRDSRNLIYCGYCNIHYKKMIRQKYKQSLRKSVPTPTTASVPPFPSPLPTHTPTPLSTTSSHPHHLPPAHPPAHSLPPTIAPIDDPHQHHYLHPKPKSREKPKDQAIPPKRHSVDAPRQSTKRKKRPRKISSSNESTASDVPSIASDAPLQPGQFPPSILPLTAGQSALPAPPTPTLTNQPLGLVHRNNQDPLHADELSHPPSLSPTEKSSENVPSHLHPQPFSPSALGFHPAPPGPASGGGDGVPGVGGGDRQPGGSTSSESLGGKVHAPPLSLHELLEKQWEQTAQFILDQAGRQNNAGVMLAHLHQLQSENRRMQTRIMELASQREFYTATTARLRQTISESETGPGRLPNGVQPLGEGLQQGPPSETDVLSPRTDKDQVPDGAVVPTSQATTNVYVMQSSLPKVDQDSLLRAHFSPATPTLASPPGKSGQSHGRDTREGRGLSPLREASHDGALMEVDGGDSRPAAQQGSAESSADYMNSARSLDGLDPTSVSVNHEITRVTNSVQAPITTYTPLALSGFGTSVQGAHPAGSHTYRARSTHASPRDKT